MGGSLQGVFVLLLVYKFGSDHRIPQREVEWQARRACIALLSRLPTWYT